MLAVVASAHTNANWGISVCLPVMSLRGQDACLRSCQYESGSNLCICLTNVQQNCAILLLFDDMVLEDLVVQGLWWFHGRRHGVCEVVVAQEGQLVGAKVRKKYQLEQEVGETRRGQQSA
jgi:hypothetical protein